MSFSTDRYTTKDGEHIFYYQWKSVNKNPKGVVQIAHGMGEHAGRYERIATLLQEQGYEVYANDHRIHGKSSKSIDSLGVYEGADFFEDAVEDMRELTNIIKKEHPSQKIILFGHSMGSFLSREYVTKYGEDVKVLIISGTASYMKGLGTLGLVSSNVIKFLKGGKKSNTILKSMFFTEFNKKFKPNRTKVDWISSDPDQVDLFNNDPYRIEDFSTNVFIDLIKGSKKINEKSAFKATPKNLPIYIFSGDKDPVGDMGKGTQKVAKQYKKAGIMDLTLKIYKDGRHEMLNETNKAEVEQDVISWLNEKVEEEN
ncbi:alpha/beta hydrolase [uncultured Aquimarina sp.]|uniref:alpha/beta hydrolase n=1 Tax=uncultured Aquimarina sp. TaxID=575652 RepID=UPI002607D5AA|nr:alpha/beta hydrolase [uncultured Aquimarina sp.]